MQKKKKKVCRHECDRIYQPNRGNDSTEQSVCDDPRLNFHPYIMRANMEHDGPRMGPKGQDRQTDTHTVMVTWWQGGLGVIIELM